MTFEARTRRKILQMLVRNVILPNRKNPKTLRRLQMQIITEEQYEALIKHGEIEHYDIDAYET